MHAWDCRCGTRNAPSLTSCRSCGGLRDHGRGVPVARPVPPAPAAVVRHNPTAPHSGSVRALPVIVALLFGFGAGFATSELTRIAKAPAAPAPTVPLAPAPAADTTARMPGPTVGLQIEPGQAAPCGHLWSTHNPFGPA